MPVSAATQWECRTTATANNVNGGGFVAGASGVDYSQQDTAQYALTGVTSAGAGNTILTASAAADMVGNIIKVVSGTNFTTINAWFEITSVVVGVSITCGTNSSGASISTGVGASGVMNIGGALSLNSTLDDDFSDQVQAGNKVWIKAGTYTLGESMVFANNGTAALEIQILGYNATRGDNPTGSNRPVLSYGSFSLTVQNYTLIKNLIITSTAAFAFATGLRNLVINCKVTNRSVTASRSAFNGFTTNRFYNCEGISYRGFGMAISGSSAAFFKGCYFHDSDVGFRSSGGSASVVLTNCIIADNVTAAIQWPTLSAVGQEISGCTLYGAENKLGIGISLVTGMESLTSYNNIIYGFVTGSSHADAAIPTVIDDYNDYFNNTTDVTNFVKGSSDVAVNPNFANVAQLTGSTATTSGSVLTQSGGDFSTVTDNVDFVYIKSGTGITAGKYLITSHTTTTITLDLAPGTSAVADKVWQITTGHNFQVGRNVQGLAFPGVFPGELTTGYLDIGAVQRQEATLAATFAG